jgi:hypothetical protein
MHHPDDDDYGNPDNGNNVETLLFGFQTEQNPNQPKQILTGII